MCEPPAANEADISVSLVFTSMFIRSADECYSEGIFLLFGRLNLAARLMFNLFKKVSLVNTTRVAILPLICRRKKTITSKGSPLSFPSLLLFPAMTWVLELYISEQLLLELSIF